jgi:hypothetical protein
MLIETVEAGLVAHLALIVHYVVVMAVLIAATGLCWKSWALIWTVHVTTLTSGWRKTDQLVTWVAVLTVIGLTARALVAVVRA